MLPSLEEPLGNVVLEGWACGVPVVASDSEGPSWLIDDGVNGLLCAKADGPALAAQFNCLQSQIDAEKLISNASEKLQRTYSRGHIVGEYLNFFDRITVEEQ